MNVLHFWQTHQSVYLPFSWGIIFAEWRAYYVLSMSSQALSWRHSFPYSSSRKLLPLLLLRQLLIMKEILSFFSWRWRVSTVVLQLTLCERGMQIRCNYISEALVLSSTGELLCLRQLPLQQRRHSLLVWIFRVDHYVWIFFLLSFPPKSCLWNRHSFRYFEVEKEEEPEKNWWWRAYQSSCQRKMSMIMKMMIIIHLLLQVVKRIFLLKPPFVLCLLHSCLCHHDEHGNVWEGGG